MPTTPNVPRFIPTLTEVVAAPQAMPGGYPLPMAPVAPAAPAMAPELPADAVAAYEEELVQRILARVEATLSDRLTDALAAVVIEQTRSLLPRVHEEVAVAVRAAVSEAVAQELAGPPAGGYRG